MLSQLNLTVWAWIESFRDLRRVRVLYPFLVLAVVQILLLIVLTQFYRPGIAELLRPWLERMQDGGATHYPQFYVFLPGIFSQANLVVEWLLGSLVFGVAFLVIWYAAFGRDAEGPWKLAGRRYVGLLFCRLPLILLLIAIALLLPDLLAREGELAGNRLRAVRYGGFMLRILIEMLFVFAPLVLLAESRSVGGALRSGMALALRVPVATALIVLVPNLVQIPTEWVLRRSHLIVRSLSPELVAILIVGTILAYVLVNYFIVAGAVRIYAARADRPGGALA